MLKSLISFATFLFVYCCEGQTLSPRVISSGGNYSISNAGSLSATIGELATTTVTGGSNILTQGFQQAEISDALPVHLLSFTAILVNEKVHLEWKTIRELNNDHFEVERSELGNHFTQFITVPGRGNYNRIHTYTAIDPFPFTDKTYYRLKQVDIGGAFTYSPIVVVKRSRSIVLSIYPNPATQSVKINITSVEKELPVVFEIYNTSGQLIKTRSEILIKGINSYEWNIAELANGLYFIRTKNLDVPVIKIMKK